MRILHVNAHHRKAGGAEVFLHSLVDALRARGHQVGFFAQEEDEERDEPELRIVRRPHFDAGRLVLDEKLAEDLRAFAQRFRPDVLHVANLHVFPATFPRVLGELGVPVLLNPQDFQLLCPNSWCVWADGTQCEGGPGKKCFEHECTKNYPFDPRNVAAARVRFLHCRAMADMVVCASDLLGQLLAKQGFRNVRTLRYFAEPAKFGGLEALARLRAATPREPEHLLCLGRLQPEKGVGVLLAAMPLVLAQRPEVRLSIVGDGISRAELEREAARLGLGKAVTFHGQVPHEAVPAFLARAGAQILPSIWAENAAQSCNDCMLMGLPMIASRIAGLPEVVRDGVNGLLFTPRDPADLAAQILRLVSEPGLAARLSAGGAEVLASHEKQAHLEQMERFYAELAHGPRPVRVPANDADLEYTLERLHGLMLDKEWAFVQADREAGRLAQALAELRATGGRVRGLVKRTLGYFSSR